MLAISEFPTPRKVELYNEVMTAIHNFKVMHQVVPVRLSIAYDLWETLLEGEMTFAGLPLDPLKGLNGEKVPFTLVAEGFDPKDSQMPIVVRERKALWAAIGDALREHWKTEGAKRDADTVTEVVKGVIEHADKTEREASLVAC